MHTTDETPGGARPPAAGPGPGRLGTLLVGYGTWGGNHARLLAAAPRIELTGIVEPSSERRDAARRAYPGVRVWAELDAALADPRTEAAVVASPLHTHARVAGRLIASGRHVLVEKPFALTAADAEYLVRAAGAAGVVAMAGHTFLYCRPIVNLARLVHDGRLSEPVFLRSERLGSQPRPDCGALWNLAPHDVAILLYLMNEPVAELSARSHFFAAGEHDDATSIDLLFPSGASAVVQVSRRTAEKRRALSVFGAAWTLEYSQRPGGDRFALEDAAARNGAAAPDALDRALREGLRDGADGGVRYREPLLAELEHFAECCRTGREPRSGGRHAAEVVRVLEAAAASAAAGGAPVRLDRADGPPPPVPGTAGPTWQLLTRAQRIADGASPDPARELADHPQPERRMPC